MESAVKVPLNYREAPWFRKMKAGFGNDVARADHVFMSVWRDLGYKASGGAVPGKLLRGDLPLLQEDLSTTDVDINALMDQLVASGFLVKDGDDFMCPPFVMLNSGMGRNSGGQIQKQGGHMRAFNARRKANEAQGMQLAIEVDAEKYVDPEGKPYDADKVRKIRVLIANCCSALFLPEMPKWAINRTTVQNAARVIEKLADDEIDQILRTIVLKRGHPALGGLNTEKLLPVFCEIGAQLTQ